MLKKRTQIGLVVATLLLAAILVITVSGQQKEETIPQLDYKGEKSILITFTVEDNKFAVEDIRVIYAPAPRQKNQYGERGTTVLMLGVEEKELGQFEIWDPRFGLEEDSDDDEMKGQIIQLKNVKFDLVVPFHKDLTSIALFEFGVPLELERSLTDVDLANTVRGFCKQNPDDPLCQGKD